jgi:hypothetical protein
MTHRTLDRLPSRPHPRMAAYSARLLTNGKGPRSYSWGCPAWLDQGQEGACVGFAWAHEAAARPVVRSDATTDLAHRLYRYAQDHDYWPGNDYDGTSVDGGAQAARHHGLIGAWYWASSAEEALEVVGRKGPAVFGTGWWTGMFDTDANGYIHRTGQEEGGHAILWNRVRIVFPASVPTGLRWRTGWLNYIDHGRSWIGLHNSWGPGWGQGGECRLSIADFVYLFSAGGEVCVPQQRKVA